jgi:hypothetical protein
MLECIGTKLWVGKSLMGLHVFLLCQPYNVYPDYIQVRKEKNTRSQPGVRNRTNGVEIQRDCEGVSFYHEGWTCVVIKKQ